jgi:hypothetical protein
MPSKWIKTGSGKVLHVEYTGKDEPTTDQIMNIFVKMGDKNPYGSKGVPKDMRIKNIQVAFDGAKDVGTLEGLVNNAARGVSFGASRYKERDSAATDAWNKANPWKSLGADIVGGTAAMVVPGGVLKTIGKIPKWGALATQLASKTPVVGAIKKVLDLGNKHKIVKSAVQGGLYAGTRSNIESRETEPNRVGKNTAGSAAAGALLGLLTHGAGNAASKLLNRKSTLATALIDKLGGEENFGRLTKAGRLIESDDPLVKNILQTAKLRPNEKVEVLKRLGQNSEKMKTAATTTLDELAPGRSQENVSERIKKIIDARYAKVDPNVKIDLNPVAETIMVGRPGSSKMAAKIVALPEQRAFVKARKRAELRPSYANDAGKSLTNEITLGNVKGVRGELFDMMNQSKLKGKNEDVRELATALKSLNDQIKAKSPEMHKADRTFSRAQVAKEHYNLGKEFKGFEPGQEPPKTSSFARGIVDRLKADRRNLSPDHIPGSLEDVVPTAHQNVLGRNNPDKMANIKQNWNRLANEKSNLEAAASNLPEYQQAVNLHGADAIRFLTRPVNSIKRVGKNALGSLENQYEPKSSDVINHMYRQGPELYGDMMKRAKKKNITGHVLSTVMAAMSKTGGRAAWGGKY